MNLLKMKVSKRKALLTEYITSNSDVSEEEAKAEIQDIDLQDVDFRVLLQKLNL